MTLPDGVSALLLLFEENGYEAYTVGGSVRDHLLGKKPNDWDITTSARPEDILSLAEKNNLRAIPTGIAHGTVTLLSDGLPIEVTTFRTDGRYSDHRRPDSVSFTSSLREDLARRDFTVNAMALSKDGELTDFFDGKADLSKRILRTVGNPRERFREDALRILRLFRFASELSFAIEENTFLAAEDAAPTLSLVSKERITDEVTRLLAGENAEKVLMTAKSILEKILPPYDERKTRAIGRLTKHPLSSHLTVLAAGEPAPVFRSLCLDNNTSRRTDALFSHLSFPLTTPTELRKLCREIGAENAKELLAVRSALGEDVREAEQSLKEILDRHDCFSLDTLAVNGKDLSAFGLKGEAIGKTLDSLLLLVIENPALNHRKELSEWICRFTNPS